MAINKKLIHFKNKSTFNSKKLSANEANTQYQVGGTGTVTTGAPDINYQSIVYIKDTKEVWTHGTFYSGTTGSSAWADITGKPSWIGDSKPSYSWSEITNKPTMVTLVEPGSPSTDWQSAYIPLDVTYSNATSAQKNISLPMATPANGSSQGSAGLITGADKKKLNALPSSGVSNIIKSRDSYVQCNNSTDDISVYAPSANVEITAGGTMNFTIGGVSMADFSADSDSHAVVVLGEGYNYITLKGSTGTGNGVFVQASDGMFVEGEVSASGGFFDTSDARVKTNVRELNAANADAIKLVEFDRTDIEHHGYGVIAQEVEKVYPSVVNTDADGFKSVNYNEIAMIKIKSLEDKVARLEDLVARLESKLS